MSNHLALATTTAALQRLLQSWLDHQLGGGVPVSAERPGSADSQFRPSDWRVNLYLYQVRPNASLRNEELPVRRNDGAFTQRPLLALDLYYLLSFFGDESTLQPQRAMGSALSALHTWPVLDRAFLNDTIASSPELAGSDLDRQVGSVRITPQHMELEDLSRIWSVLLQTPYVPSVPYVASVILLEPDLDVGRPLPVGGRVASVALQGRPRLALVEKVKTPSDGSDAISAGSRIRLRGSGLAAESVEVHIGRASAIPEPDDVREDAIVLELASVSGLRAGLQPLWLVQPLSGGNVGAESEAISLAIRPLVSSVVVLDEVVGGGGLLLVTLQVNVDVTVEPEQRVQVWLNLQPGTPGAPGSAGAHASSRALSSDPLVFVVRDVAPGNWLVRVMVDGAESPLERAAPEPGQSTGRYAAPSVVLGAGP